MDVPAPKLIDAPAGSRWCGPVLLAALPLQVLLGAVLLAGEHSAWQLAYAGLASSLLVVTGLALLRLRNQRARGVQLLVEATRRIGRRDFARLPHYTAAAANIPDLAPLGQACLQAAAQLRRRFARLESALELDRWLLTVHDPLEMLRGVLPLASGILQGRSVSVALLSATEPGLARCHDYLAEGPLQSPAPRELRFDAARFEAACAQHMSIDLAACGVDVREFYAPLAANGARAFRVCPLHAGGHAIGFLCVGYRVELHDHEDERFDAGTVAERLSLAFGRIVTERATMQPRPAAAPQSPLETGLHRALQRDELSLAWQPIVRAHSRELCAVEALVRWQDERVGRERTAAEFIPVAEESGLIIDLGEWVLHAACAQFADWQREGLELDYVSVNVSPHQLRHAGLVPSVLATLHRHGMQPGQLQLEIKESLLDEGPLVLALLGELAGRGVRLALDDYGDGNSSLAALRDLPVTALKIDSACVAGITDSEQVRALVRAVAGMGAVTGKLVIAEGVERIEQLRFLEEAGCDALQGYLFAAPMAAAGIREFAGRAQLGRAQPGRSRVA
jgi:EAL domain-containing protein (putative c-di-GMP-specific phosphodiesterase class I)